ncbi:MAG: c-type cytochrome [Janthinobacterium lividum]
MSGLLAVGLVAASIGHPGVLAQQAAPQPTAPSQPTAPTAQAGAVLFSGSGCTQCHGPEGNGTAKAPNIHEVRKRKTDEEIYLQIKEGKGAMPAFGDALSEEELRSIVAFLRAKDGWKLLPAVPEK